MTPSASTSAKIGVPLTPYARKDRRGSSVATRSGNGWANRPKNASSVATVSSVIATTEVLRSFSNARSSGSAALQGPHQVAQKYNRWGPAPRRSEGSSPRYAASSRGFQVGAAVDTRGGPG